MQAAVVFFNPSPTFGAFTDIGAANEGVESDLIISLTSVVLRVTPRLLTAEATLRATL